MEVRGGKTKGRRAMLQGMVGRNTGDSVAREESRGCVEGKRERKKGTKEDDDDARE